MSDVDTKLFFAGGIYNLEEAALEFYQLHDLGIILRLQVKGRDVKDTPCALKLKGIYLLGFETVSKLLGQEVEVKQIPRSQATVAELTIGDKIFQFQSIKLRFTRRQQGYFVQLSGQLLDVEHADQLREISATIFSVEATEDLEV